MAFGNDDPIDKRHRARIRELESGLRELTAAFLRSTSMTQNEKEQAILEARRVLAG